MCVPSSMNLILSRSMDLVKACYPRDHATINVCQMLTPRGALQAEFYSYATTGAGLPASLLGSNPGPTTGGQMANLSAPIMVRAASGTAVCIVMPSLLRSILLAPHPCKAY